ncbi:MAG: AAA family ATPase [Atopobiaceae bacterium]|nr:AAA family ATPase [Atopobiaceae bacterium]
MMGKEYHMGLVNFDHGKLQAVLDAITFLRAQGLVMSVGQYRVIDAKTRLPVGIRCRVGQWTVLEPELDDIFDGCELAWRKIIPSVSSPECLRAVRTIDAAEDAGGVTLSEVTPPSEIGDPFEGLVGLGETIDAIRNVADAVTAYGRDALESLHMTFLGNPGVGKTELAHRMAQYYRKQGVIEGGLHKYSASDLICEHVGSAPRLMSRAFDEAAGGILFIDEAYALVQGRGNEFGTESVNTMVECMDDRRHDVIVIAAGYPSEMEQFLAANPGLRDRFGFQMDIKDYTPHQLGSIYRQFANAKNFELEDSLDDEALAAHCGRMMGSKGFAGARTMRKVFNESVLAAASRHPQGRFIDTNDLDKALSKLSGNSTTSGVVGFA